MNNNTQSALILVLLAITATALVSVRLIALDNAVTAYGEQLKAQDNN